MLNILSEIMNEEDLEELTPRTDYVVLGQHEALIMMSARRLSRNIN